MLLVFVCALAVVGYFIFNDTSRTAEISNTLTVKDIKKIAAEEKLLLEEKTRELKRDNTLGEKIIENELREGNSRLEGVLALIRQGKKDIEFKARFVDQNGDPVGNAKVTTSVSGAFGLQNPDIEIFFTDANGLLNVNGVSGYLLRILDVEKAGYIFKREDYNFYSYKDTANARLWKEYSDTPLGIPLWKVEERVELSDGYIKYRIKNGGGKKYTLSLLKEDTIRRQLGVVEEGGNENIAFYFNRNENIKKSSRRDKNPWSFSMGFNEGGLIEIEDTYVYRAPVDGYQHEWSVDFAKGDADWVNVVRKQFYILTVENGRKVYGRIDISVIGYSGLNGDAVFSANYSINPSGDVNLTPVK